MFKIFHRLHPKGELINSTKKAFHWIKHYLKQHSLSLSIVKHQLLTVISNKICKFDRKSLSRNGTAFSRNALAGHPSRAAKYLGCTQHLYSSQHAQKCCNFRGIVVCLMQCSINGCLSLEGLIYWFVFSVRMSSVKMLIDRTFQNKFLAFFLRIKVFK